MKTGDLENNNSLSNRNGSQNSGVTDTQYNTNGEGPGKSLKTIFTEYLNRNSATRPLDSVKSGATIEFNQQSVDSVDNEAHIPESPPTVKANDRDNDIGGFISVTSGKNVKKSAKDNSDIDIAAGFREVNITPTGSKNANTDAAGEFADDEASGYAGDVADGYAGGYAGDEVDGFAGGFAGDEVDGYAGDLTGGFAGGYAGDVAGGFTSGYADRFAGDLTGDLTGGFLGDEASGYADGFAGGFAGDEVDGFAGDLTGDLTVDLTGDLTGGFAGVEASGYADGFADDVADGFSDGYEDDDVSGFSNGYEDGYASENEGGGTGSRMGAGPRSEAGPRAGDGPRGGNGRGDGPRSGASPRAGDGPRGGNGRGDGPRSVASPRGGAGPRSGGGAGGADGAGGENAGGEGERRPTPREVALKAATLSYTAIKWVMIYMGRFISTVFKIALVIILVIAFGILGAGVGAIYGYIQGVEPITSIMLEMKIQSSYIYDADGNQLARLTGSGNVNRQLVHYNEISPFIPRALIAIEDKRFESHNGVDPKRIVGAGLKFILGGSDAYGASTITQQLVKNVTGKKDETLERKVQEWYLAIELEKTMEKWKILELYLNVVYFGNGCYGVSSASRTYYGKAAADLSLAESALLVGITNSPGKYNPFTETGLKNAKTRQAVILNEMLKQGMISDEEYDEALAEKITVIPKAVTAAVTLKPNSYFIDCVIDEVKNDLMAEKGMTSEMALAQIYNYGLRIYTTQSPGVQSALDSVFNDPQYFPDINPDAQKNNELPQGAMVILDPNTAQIKAICGGYGEKLADRTFNRATQARRQPGSSIKPIAVYGPALDQHTITLATVVDDTPSHYDPVNPERIYPKNSSNDFRGLTTIRDAIRRSVNVVAVKTWLRIPDTSHKYLDKSGINRDSETQVALALGGLHKGVTPLEMAAAYVPFDNRGMYYTPTTYTKVLDSDGRVLLDNTVRPPTIIYNEQTAFLMTSALEDVIKTGTGTAAALFGGDMPAAGKTGTTNDNADRWFVGYTPYYVAATWYGYDNKIKKITLTQDELGNAMRIWRTVMERIHDGLMPKEFPIPDQIVTASVCAYSGKAPTAACRNDPRGSAIRTEYFIKGTEPKDLDKCDVHVTTKVCLTGSAATGGDVAAGPYCPDEEVKERVVTKREAPFTPMPGDPYPNDWLYEYKNLPLCPYHTADGIAAEFAPEPEEEPEPEDATDASGAVNEQAGEAGGGGGSGGGELTAGQGGGPGAGGTGGAGDTGGAGGAGAGDTGVRIQRTPRPNHNVIPSATEPSTAGGDIPSGPGE